MTENFNTIRALLLCFIASSLIFAPPANAQSDEERTVDLPAQPLQQSLVELGAAYGVTIVGRGDLTDNVTGSAVSGSLTLKQALSALLTETGLETRRSQSGTIVVQERSAETQEVRRRNAVSTPASEPPRTIEEITVVGTKKGLSLQETRESVAVFTKEEIADQVLFNLSDVTLRAANVTTSRNRSVTIRGINASGVGTSGSGLTTNVYVDGAPTTSTTFGLNLWDVEQVEILRGPQSTTQGRNALAGAVVVSTADPEYDLGANIQILAGNNDNRQYSGTITGPIIDDQLAFRLAADLREIDFGVNFNSTGEPASFEETLTVRGKLLFEPTTVPQLRSELNVQFVETDGTAVNFLQAPVPFGEPDFTNFDPFGDVTFDAFNNTNDVKTLRVLLENQIELSQNWSIYSLGTYEDTDTFLDRQVGFSDRAAETYSAEIRAMFDHGRWSGWFGGYYFDEEAVRTDVRDPQRPSDFGLVTDPPDATVSSASSNASEVENYAFFFEGSYRLNDQWSLEFGARYDIEDVFDTGEQGSVTDDPQNCIVPAFGNLDCDLLLPVSNEPPFSTKYEAFLPRGGITYRFDDLRMLAFGVQRGYRAGGAFTLPGGEIQSFDPEYITNYELAFRSQWMDRKGMFNANVFFADWSDQQIQLPDPFSLAPLVTVNAGASELYGLELELSYLVSSGLQVFGSLGFLETEFTDFPFALVESTDSTVIPLAADGGFANLSGNNFPNAASVSATAGLNYESSSGVFGNLTVSYTGDRFSDVENLRADEVDAFVVANLRIGYRSESLEISAFANNLFDEKYLVESGLQRVRTSGAPATAATELIENNPAAILRPGDRRQVGVVISARF